MNIIKLKDQITSSDFFNENLKGKYAIAFNYNYIFPLGITGISETVSQIINVEQQKIGEVSGEIDIEMSGGTTGTFLEGSD